MDWLTLYTRSSDASEETALDNSSGSGDLCAVDHDSYSAGHNITHGTVLFLFAAFAVGALVRHVLKNTPIPYTVILIILGLAFGAASNVKELSILRQYTGIAKIDPHLMLFVFLPTLIFESAFVMDVHTFKKTIGQSMLLAGPGLIMCSFLTCLLAKYIFTYEWSWVAALMFGAIMSATDPVAVVALLKDLGASKQLGTIIEGESLLNDGAAIVIFNVLLFELIPGQSQSALQMFTYFIRVAFGGPAFGYLTAKVTIFWLSHVFNDALVEITITLASTYLTFYIGEAILGVSGVLAVVTLGIELNSRRTNISPEVEVFLHRFWGMLGYLANTLIFLLVGVVIAQQAFSRGVDNIDWMFMVALYIGIMVIRLIVIGALAPLLTHIGYSINWKQVIVIVWGGLRGAVGLSLALVVSQTPQLSDTKIGSKVLFHTAGIVVLTLLVNATTIKYLLQALGMSDISNARRLTMSTAVRRVRDAQQRAISMLRSDRFLADAHWELVEETTVIDDPYSSRDNEHEFAEDSVVAASGIHSQCPKCETDVPRIPHPKELAELVEEVRMRMVKTQKTSYWRQFEHGMLGRQAVLILINLADTVMDTPERLITLNDLQHYWRIPTILTKLRLSITALYNWKSSDLPPKPTVQCCDGPYKLVTHFLFEWTLFGVIMINGICTIVELSIKHTVALQVLQYLNYAFCVVYIVEAILKIVGLRQYYFQSKWNLFDLFILAVSLADIIIELSIPKSTSTFSPAVLRIVRVLRVLRVGRVLRLMKLMLPLLIRVVDKIINRRLRFGYDIGKGFVVGEDEMLQQYDRIASVVHKNIAQELRRRAELTRLEVIRSLGLMRKEHPGVALSVKTFQAVRSVLNHCNDTIKQLQGSGVLDEQDAEKLIQLIEVKMKRLESTPASLPPPDPIVILCNLAWLNGLSDDILGTIKGYATLVQFEHGDIMINQGDSSKGIYIIVSGLVKVAMYYDSLPPPHHHEVHPPVKSSLDLDTPKKSSSSSADGNNIHVDFFGAGSVMGEMGILLQTDRCASVECETDVQAFFIEESDLHEIMKQHPIVQDRLWRLSGIRIAILLLTSLPEYQNWPMSKLQLLCEGAFVATPPLGPVPTFEILEEHKEVVLISGEVRCMNSREKLVAPCIIPKVVRHVLMNNGNPKLLVIPNVDLSADLPEKPGQNKDTINLHNYKPKKRKFSLKVVTKRGVLKLWRALVHLYLKYTILRGMCKSICKRRKVQADDQDNELCELGEMANQQANERVHTPVTPIRDGSAGPEIQQPHLAFQEN